MTSRGGQCTCFRHFPCSTKSFKNYVPLWREKRSYSPLVAITAMDPTPNSTVCVPRSGYCRDLWSHQGHRFMSDGRSYHLHTWGLSICSIIEQQDFQKIPRLTAAPRRPSANRMHDNRWFCFIYWAAGQGFDPLSPTAAQIAAVFVLPTVSL